MISNDWNFFHNMLATCLHFLRNICSDLLPIFNQHIFLLFFIQVLVFLIYSEYYPSVKFIDYKYFLSFYRLSIHPKNCFTYCTKPFYFSIMYVCQYCIYFLCLWVLPKFLTQSNIFKHFLWVLFKLFHNLTSEKYMSSFILLLLDI
jgi:hypothetical protein